jgi:hypothetical protein
MEARIVPLSDSSEDERFLPEGADTYGCQGPRGVPPGKAHARRGICRS